MKTLLATVFGLSVLGMLSGCVIGHDRGHGYHRDYGHHGYYKAHHAGQARHHQRPKVVKIKHVEKSARVVKSH